MKLCYKGGFKEIDIYLDREIKFLKDFAKEIVREHDTFEKDKHAIRLLYRGAIMDEARKLGNYIRESGPVQIFKLERQH